MEESNQENSFSLDMTYNLFLENDKISKQYK